MFASHLCLLGKLFVCLNLDKQIPFRINFSVYNTIFKTSFVALVYDKHNFIHLVMRLILLQCNHKIR